MSIFGRRVEIILVPILFLTGAAFLLRMCYLSLTFNTIFGLIFLAAVYYYTRRRYGQKLPLSLLLLVFAALQVDALGNYFRLYGRPIGPMQYDEFSHLTIQILVTPLIIWIVQKVLESRGYHSAMGLGSFLASTTIFSVAALYEIIELWDELYFNGQRIWSKYDTATDLQWDLLGILIGVALSNLAMRIRVTVARPSHREA